MGRTLAEAHGPAPEGAFAPVNALAPVLIYPPRVPTSVPTSAPVRLQSLDVFRGVTMAAMVIVNNPGDWGHVYAPLLHAEWHGCTPTDLVFPFFLFIVGFAVTLSRKSGRWVSLLRRALTIIALGWFLHGFPWFNLAKLRIPGVLPRIGLCYLAAASLYHVCATRGAGLSQEARDRMTAKVAAAAAAMLLLGYWAILMLVPGGSGTPGDLTPEGNLAAVIDRALLSGHIYRPHYDPEGLLSTLPAIGTTLLGVLTGLWFRSAPTLEKKAIGLAVGGAVLAAIGLAWGQVFPLNKALWTSSFAVYTAGLGAVLLAACIWFVDIRGWRRVAYPFVVLGTNAIALYVLSGLIARTLGLVKLTGGDGVVRSLKTVIYDGLFVPLASPINASLLFAIANLVVLYGVLWVMYKRGIFLKV
jgi:predicted acyltransferase